MTSDEIHYCNKCDYKTSKDKDNLREHKRSQHSDIMYPCDQCDYKAPLPAGLKDHKELKHGKDKHFCDQCDYKTPLYKYLRTHKKSHEDYRFACSECDHTARQSTNSKKQNGAC